MKKLEAEVYQTETHIIIVGSPDDEDELHNCDAMGCGQEHVLYRFKLPQAELFDAIDGAWQATETERQRVHALFLQKLEAEHPGHPWTSKVVKDYPKGWRESDMNPDQVSEFIDKRRDQS